MVSNTHVFAAFHWRPSGTADVSAGRKRLVRLLGMAAFGAAVAANPAFAADKIEPNAEGLAAVSSTAKSSAKPGPTKLTLGLDTLASEYRAYAQAVSAATVPAGTFVSTKTLAAVSRDNVVIDAVAADDPEALVASLKALGAEVTAVAGRLVSARLPLDQLPALDGVEALKFARPALALTRTGSVTSQGDEAQRSDLARVDFGVAGAGSTVGVLSDSFDCLGGYAADVATDDLPAGVAVLDDSACPGSDEGRAMAQIVYDVAPGAGLAFHTAFNGEADFAQGIQDLAAAGSTIIVDDVIYLAEPMFQDGVIAQAVNAVKDMGIPYFSSAGNNGREAYEAAFNDSGFVGYFGGMLHDFDPGPDVATRLAIQQNATTTYVMQWQDPFFSVSGAPGAATDLDICFYSPAGAATPFSCSAANNIGSDPVEASTITGTRSIGISIERYSGPNPNPVKVVMFGDIDFVDTYAGTNAGTLYGHANAAGANAVGASAYFFTPAFGTDPPELNSYSSAGNTPILFDTAGNSTVEIREKPEFTAPDGGNNTFFGTDYESDGWPNFFGTSAAAPHAAGVAALMREISPGLTPAYVTRLLQYTAVDILNRNTGEALGAGYDNDSGAGLINAQDALAAIGPDLIGVWRPSTRVFLLDSNGSNTWDGTAGGDTLTARFGLSTDLPVTGDWNGDGKDEIGVWRPSIRKFLLDSNGSNTWNGTAGGDTLTARFGLGTDLPVAGDWNGDGKDEIGVWRPSIRKFLLDSNGNNAWNGTVGGDTLTGRFGVDTDLPVTGDWNGDGKDEVGVWRPSTGRFLLDSNGNNTWDGTAGGDTLTERFGVSTDLPVTGDWNGDGKDEVGVRSASTREFLLDSNGNNSWDGAVGGDTLTNSFGLADDLPVAGRW